MKYYQCEIKDKSVFLAYFNFTVSIQKKDVFNPNINFERFEQESIKKMKRIEESNTKYSKISFDM